MPTRWRGRSTACSARRREPTRTTSRPGRPPGGFGPGMMMAPRIVEAIDANKDGRISPDEAARGAERFVRDAEPPDRPLDRRRRLASAINSEMGPPPGFGGPGGPMGAERKLIKEYDKAGDGRLDQENARWLALTSRPSVTRTPGVVFGRPRRFGPPGGWARRNPARPARRSPRPMSRPSPARSSTTPTSLRTFFLDFEDNDWEAALQDFHATDVEVPATLTVDGRKYPGVGVHFPRDVLLHGGPRRAQAVAERCAGLRRPEAAARRVQDAQPPELARRPDLPAHGLVSPGRPHYIPAPKANFVQVVDQRRKLGPVHQRPAVRQGPAGRELPERQGDPLEGAGQPGGGRRPDVCRRRDRGVPEAVRDQDRQRRRRLACLDQPCARRSTRPRPTGSKPPCSRCSTSTACSGFLPSTMP